RHRLGVIRIIVGRIQLLGTHIDRLVPQPLQLIDEAVLELEADMIGPDINLLRHRSLTPRSSKLLQHNTTACHPERRRREGPAFRIASDAGPSLRALRALRSG